MITVIVPFYNNSSTIRLCMDSILQQTYPNFEILAVSDGSTDDSTVIIRNIGDPRIRIIEQKNNGVSSARNRGLMEAMGQYCTFLDADDAYDPTYLAALLEYKDYDLTGCGIEYTGKNSRAPLLHSFDCPTPESISLQMDALLNSGILNSPVTKLYHMDLIRGHHILFREDMDIGEDFNFNFRYLECCGSLKNISKALYRYNMGEGLHSRRISNVIAQRKINIDLLEQYYKNHHFDMQLISQMKLKLIYIYCMQECQGTPDKQKMKQELDVPYFHSIGPVTGNQYRIMKAVYQTKNIDLMLLLARKMLKMKNSGKRIDGASI